LDQDFLTENRFEDRSSFRQGGFMQRPKVARSLPGPKARRILALDRRYISPSYTRSYPAVVESGEGCWVWDVDGNRFLDFNAGIAVCATGHCHPAVVEAISRQAKRLIHMSGTDYYYPQQVQLAEKLADIAPIPDKKRVFFCNSGAEAVEAGVKLARHILNRPYFIAFFGAFHGRTLGALSLTASKYVQKSRFGPLLSGVFHVPYAYCYRCAYHLEHPSCEFECVKYIENQVMRTVAPPDEIAAVIVEPVQGEGGYVVPPPGYHQRLRELCDKHGILLIADEVQSGMGRTGRMMAIEHWDVQPDIICLAKGMGSGMPIGAIVARSQLMRWREGTHASTFGGNPVCAAAALATIELLQNGLVENARKMGELFMARLETMQPKHDCVGDVRGKGLMIGVEFVESPVSKRPNPDRRNAVVQRAFELGLILQGCGPNSIRFAPPLTVSEEEVEVGLEIFEQALRDTAAD
jgi:4-aminobutyrate aminotransferase